jgi:anti-sigma factor RsiW
MVVAAVREQEAVVGDTRRTSAEYTGSSPRLTSDMGEWRASRTAPPEIRRRYSTNQFWLRLPVQAQRWADHNEPSVPPGTLLRGRRIEAWWQPCSLVIHELRSASRVSDRAARTFRVFHLRRQRTACASHFWRYWFLSSLSAKINDHSAL